jgi:hypothetical protein
VTDDEWNIVFTKTALATRRELPPGPIRAGFDAALDVIGYNPLGVGRRFYDVGLDTERCYRVGSAGFIVYSVAHRTITIASILWAG